VPLDESLGILRDIARALAYAHARDIVHRDIKPDNVLLSSGTAVVTDFGIAKALSASRDTESEAANITLTRAGTSLGTPAYMSPEQALGDMVDARTDIYAWGMIAYELLAGVHPFAAHTTSQRLIAAQISEIPASLATKTPAVPAGIAALVMRCLAKDPADRPANGGELLSQLSAAPAQSPRRRRWPIAAAATLLIAAAAAIAIVVTPRRIARSTSTRSVVVVPFDNLGNPADAYFAEGMSDEIAGQLARIPGLEVIGREGVKRFRGSQESPRDIARQLGAAYVLSGTVRWAKQRTSSGALNGAARVRIVPTLLDVQTGTQKWGQPYEEPLTDVFQVQSSVAEQVAAALSVTLGDTARAALHHRESASADAQDAQLRGRYLLRQRGAQNLMQAVEAFKRAIALDSSYARAWAGLSEANALLPAYYDSAAANLLWKARADSAAQRAFALDSTLPEVQIALARAREVDYRFREALPTARKVVTLDPNGTLGYVLEYEVLTALGRVAEADTAIRRAFILDSLSPLVLTNFAIVLASEGKNDSAIRLTQRSVELSPDIALWKRNLVLLYALAGRERDVERTCTGASASLSTCAMAGAFTNDRGRRAAAITALGESGRPGAITIEPGFAVIAYAQLGMADSVFSRISAGIASRDDVLLHSINWPSLEPYHKDPRWDAIVGGMRRR
jgi:eukaryotic-like serine/threonine-protein kinase